MIATAPAPSKAQFLSPSSSASSMPSSPSSRLASPSTSCSSFSSLGLTDVAPLPSPPASPASKSKTAAFFGSPFSSRPPTPALPSRSSSTGSKGSKLRGGSGSERGEDAEPTPVPEHHVQIASRTDSFFSNSSIYARPTPPSSIHSQSRGASPPPPPSTVNDKLPNFSLARMFPHKYRGRGDEENVPPRRDLARTFIDIDAQPQSTHGAYCSSPKSATFPRADGIPFPSKSPSPKVTYDGLPTSHPDLHTLRVDTLSPTHLPTSPTNLPSPLPLSCSPPSAPVPIPSPAPPELKSGSIVRPLRSHDKEDQDDDDLQLRLELLQALGQGAFSSVWLARDLTPSALVARSKSTKSVRRVRRRVTGVRPKGRRGRGPEGGGEEGEQGKKGSYVFLSSEDPKSTETEDSPLADGEAASLSAHPPVPPIPLPSSAPSSPNRNSAPTPEPEPEANSPGGRVVALKMTDRTASYSGGGGDAGGGGREKERERERTGVSFVREVEVLKHISHPSIARYLSSFSTPSHHVLVLEYCGGGELFEVVDKDEKHALLTESLLRRMWTELCKAVGWMHSVGLVHRDIKLENILLTRPLPTTEAEIPPPSQSLIKLSDFGLSRFVDLDSPLLRTRCGSESYAAPELVLGQAYDGRMTDAWALGVVLYALVCRVLPFDLCEREREQGQGQGRNRGAMNARERRSFLMRIAKGEYTWPEETVADEGAGELRGAELVKSEGVRKVVGRLLVRDAKKRARVVELWGEGWMRGEGAVSVPAEYEEFLSEVGEAGVEGAEGEVGEGEGGEEVEEEEGVLVDGDAIASVAKQEIQ